MISCACYINVTHPGSQLFHLDEIPGVVFIFVPMATLNFDDYKDECIGKISALQEEFIRLYDLNSYERWSFENDFGVFKFESNSGKILYFQYSLAGSFSTRTSTWKWSWDNPLIKASERKYLNKVKAFGEQNNFSDLTTGLINGDEFTGHEMTGISAVVLSAIGIYHFTEDHLTFFVVFRGELTQEQYENLKQTSVLCRTHGASRAAFVCQHLNTETYTGFHEAFESSPLIEPHDDYQAWCDECENVRLQEGEWNDVSEGFAKIRVVCDQCFFEMKRRNVEQ